MINRFMFIGYGSVKNASSYQGTDLIHIFEFEDKSFLYLESENETPDVSKLPCDGLKPFPDGNFWVLMPNVFLTSVPLSAEHWNRNRGNNPSLRINRLKYQKVSSYIFNHYRMQEEEWDHGREKYDAIFIFGTLLVYYSEVPRKPDDEPYNNSLSTHDTPWDGWHDLMEQHFDPIKGYDSVWIYCKKII